MNTPHEIVEVCKMEKTVESLKSDAYTDIFDSVINTLNSKDTQYTDDPIEVLSVEDLLCQIKIKAVRAQLTSPVNVAKLEDELLDIITYSMLTLKKVRAKHNILCNVAINQTPESLNHIVLR